MTQQLAETRRENESTNDSFSQTLEQMRDQTAAQGRFADAAGRSADAARRAANIAESALHVSERAYLVVGAFDVDEDTGSIKVPISNIGRIPSGR